MDWFLLFSSFAYKLCDRYDAQIRSWGLIRILKTENNSEIINPLFDGLPSNKDGNLANCSYFSSPLQGSKTLLRTSHKVYFLFSEGTVTNPVLWWVLSAVHIFLSLSTGTVTLSWVAESSIPSLPFFINKFHFAGWALFLSRRGSRPQADK